jgi:hypothetical protein
MDVEEEIYETDIFYNKKSKIYTYKLSFDSRWNAEWIARYDQVYHVVPGWDEDAPGWDYDTPGEFDENTRIEDIMDNIIRTSEHFDDYSFIPNGFSQETICDMTFNVSKEMEKSSELTRFASEELEHSETRYIESGEMWQEKVHVLKRDLKMVKKDLLEAQKEVSQLKKQLKEWSCPNDGVCYTWEHEGEMYYRNFYNHIYKNTSDGPEWVGIATKVDGKWVICRSVVLVEEEEEEDDE